MRQNRGLILFSYGKAAFFIFDGAKLHLFVQTTKYLWCYVGISAHFVVFCAYFILYGWGNCLLNTQIAMGCVLMLLSRCEGHRVLAKVVEEERWSMCRREY